MAELVVRSDASLASNGLPVDTEVLTSKWHMSASCESNIEEPGSFMAEAEERRSNYASENFICDFGF